MRAGALTLLTKPVDQTEMLTVIDEAVSRDQIRRSRDRAHSDLRGRFDTLTPRERDVLALVTAGLMNKQIAGRLELSEITVKIHRGNMMRKMAADSLADLVRMTETLGIRPEVGRYSHSQIRCGQTFG
jgi:FixJ family two-component response regulator